MAVDVILSAQCDSCGLQMNASCNDRYREHWVWCPTCEEVDGLELGRNGRPLLSLHPNGWDCERCGKRRAAWDHQFCPRCSQPIKTRFGIGYD